MDKEEYDVSEVLISEEQLQARVMWLGSQITKDFEGRVAKLYQINYRQATFG